MMITRRGFVGQVAALATVSSLHSQENTRSDWGGPVVDCHHHMRRTLEANLLHLDGCGMSSAMMLARDNSSEQIAAWRTQSPGRFLGWFASTDITKPEADELLTKAVKAGAIGF